MRELCACGFDLSMRDMHFRNMHNATCMAKVREQATVEEIVAMFEHALSQGLFSSADDLLQIMQIDVLPPAALIGVLAITYHAKNKLKHRDAFFVRVETQLKAELGAARAEDLLRTRR